MNRIDAKFKELKRRRQKAFIAYITAGDPDLTTTKKLVGVLERAGVDIIELGIPFSDPLADGPTIQAASHRALLKGVNLKKIFAAVKDMRKSTQIPLVFMTYYNPVLKYGVRRFVGSCSKTGVDGVIVPDLPYEEAGELVTAARKARVAAIFLAAPTSTKARLVKIAKNSTGFIYYVSLTGVTGARSRLPKELAASVKAVRSVTDKPVAVGFGISTPDQARAVARLADGVIIGSAIVKMAASNVSSFAKRLAGAIHNV